MKDAYTFDRDREGLDAHYERYREAYDRIFDRIGLEWYRVESDVGMMGGVGAHEYMAPSAAGENDVALAPGYAANVEVATAKPSRSSCRTAARARARRDPRPHDRRGGRAGAPRRAGALIKAYPVIVEDRGLRLVVRGDHRVNEIKLGNARRVVPPCARGGVRRAVGPAGFIGPVDIDVPILLDDAVDPARTSPAPTSDDAHLRGVEPGRDFPFTRADVRTVEAGDTVDGHPIRIEPAIEIGNIFKLGTRYSEPLGATYLDEHGAAQPIWMGPDGLGPARIAAAAVEQFADEQGISWPRSIAPWDIHIARPSASPGSEGARGRRPCLRPSYRRPGSKILDDDRDAGPGRVRRRRAARRPCCA